TSIFSTMAGWVSYAAIPEDARGSDLKYAAFRATKNGEVRYVAWDGAKLLLQPFGGFSVVWAKFSAWLGFNMGKAHATLDARKEAMDQAGEAAMHGMTPDLMPGAA